MYSHRSPATDGVCRLATALAIALAIAGCSGGTAVEPPGGQPGAPSGAKPPQKGALRRWPEATSYLRVNLDAIPVTVELGPARLSGMDAFWSIASTKAAGSAFFYSDVVRGGDETRVANAAGIARVQDIRDASTFDYSARSVGPVPVSGIVLLQHLPSDRYLALVLDAIESVDARSAGAGPYAYADVTWYLTEAGAVDFSSAF